MDLNLSLEETMLKDSVDGFARDYLLGSRAASRASPEGFSRATWQSIVDLGFVGVGLPEAMGGYGGTSVDTMLIHEAIGAGLVVEPLLSTTLAARLIGLAGTQAQRDRVLPAILSGEQLAIVAHYENVGRGDPSYIETVATPDGEGWILRGHKDVVLNASSADHVIVSARLQDKDDIALFLVEGTRLRERLIPCETIDGMRAADIVLDGFRLDGAERMTGAPDTGAALIEAIDHATVANCAEALGAMDAALAITADYLNTRQQFGQPIGTFQALQHKLADMVIAIELARSILLYALATLSDADPKVRGRAVSAAKVRVIESADVVQTHAIQLHGGIGVTEEHVISHYFRKLAMTSRRFGSVDYHVARFEAA
jgi:alkylation response protein AidB-like acyl-CoA dehydrogenase